MTRKEIIRGILDAAWYLVLFLMLQAVFSIAFDLAQTHFDWNDTPTSFALSSALSCISTIAIFAWRRYSPVGRTYLQSMPWIQLTWTCFLSLGLILPLEWIYEQINIQLPEQYKELFEGIMSSPWGYLSVGILGPVAEEMVFRGAILRRLAELTGNRWQWLAIVVSALLFGIAHGNVAQGINAFLIGLLLGWLYLRTRSVVPGIAFHWMNNTVAYIMYKILPDMADGKLIDLFHGDHKLMAYGLGCSLLIIIPSLFQVVLSVRKR